MFEALLQHPIAHTLAHVRRALPPETNLRLKLSISPSEISRLPLALLFDLDQQVYLFTSLTNTIVRVVESNTPVASLRVPWPLRSLLPSRSI